MTQINKYRNFSQEKDHTAFSVIRLQSSNINKLGGRNTWVLITNQNKCIYRLILGARNSTGFTAKSLEIDYDSCLKLGISSSEKDENNFYPCNIEIKKANWIGRFIAHWKHPNPAYRVPMQLGIMGFILGFFSLLISIIGYIQ